MVVGDVLIACGLSSSASYEMAALVLFEALGGFTIEGPDAPKLGRRVGMNSWDSIPASSDH